MKSAKNLLKKIYGGNYEPTEQEVDFLRESFCKFEKGDIILYKGGIKYKRITNKHIRKNPAILDGDLDTPFIKWLGDDDSKLVVGESYLIEDISLCITKNIDFENPLVVVKLVGVDGYFSQSFFENILQTINVNQYNLKDLETFLREAVENEDFELAAKYRDQINKIKS